MSKPTSLAYLLLWHTPFKDLSPEDQARFLESMTDAPIRHLEYVEGKTGLDRFLGAIPQRDTVFSHDMVRLLHEKGVRSVSPPAQVFNPALSTTLALLRELDSDEPSPGRLSALRLAAGLLEAVHKIRPASPALKDVEALVQSSENIREIDGLPPQAWLASRGLPAGQFDLPEIKGWASSGSDSEMIQMGGRLVRGLSRQLEKEKKVLPEHRLAMDIVLLAWSGPTSAKVDPNILERWQGKDPKELSDLVFRATKLMAAPDQHAMARTSALLMMAAKGLGVAAQSLGSEKEGVVAALGSRLLLRGLQMRREGDAPLLNRAFLVDVVEKVQYSEHSKNGIVRAMATLPGGAEEALSLWIPFSDDTFPDAQEFAMYAWVDNTVQSLYPHPDRFLEVVDALGDPLMKALERHNPLQRNILPRIAKAREKQMSVQMPKPKEPSPAAPRQRF